MLLILLQNNKVVKYTIIFICILIFNWYQILQDGYKLQIKTKDNNV